MRRTGPKPCSPATQTVLPTFAVDFASAVSKKTSMDGSNGDAAAGGPNPAGGDGPGQGGVALLSDPVDVIIDKLLR